MRAQVISRSGFTLVEIMIVVAIIGLLVSMALPSWHRARENAQLNSIANNLRILEGAKQQWAMENKKSTTDSVSTTDLTTYLKNNTLPQAVVGETYVTAAVADPVIANTSAVLVGKQGPFSTTSF
jgi:prepilin-type N-terminal cleavage/methylation domain-containing protein